MNTTPTIRQILERDPSREITSFIRITDHDPRLVWSEMDEYDPSLTKQHFRDALDILLDTRRGATERVCVWVYGFFGSGKSHFLKTLGYLLKDYPLEDPDGHPHSSQEYLCNKLGLQNNHAILKNEFNTEIIFINLLNNDPQSPTRPTISRLVYRGLLEQSGLSTEFWVAIWEKEFQNLGKWEQFLEWVRKKYGRDWQEERELNAEVVLKRALPELMGSHYRSEEEADNAIQESKTRRGTINPSDVAETLRKEAEILDPVKGRIIVLLDEVGLYIGDSIERLTDLNALAEQVIQTGRGKVIMLVTAQEALTELVPRLTADKQILEWLKDRFRVRIGLEPTGVETVVGSRMLAKTSSGVSQLRLKFKALRGRLIENLSLEKWSEDEFIRQYPFAPYSIRLMQSIMGSMRGSIDEARRLAGSERSMLKQSQVLLNGEGGITVGADQPVGWMAGLDSFFDALRPDLSTVRSEQVMAIMEIGRLGDVDDLPVQRIAKALFLLQQVGSRYPCTVDNITSALVNQIDIDRNALRDATQKGLDKMASAGWVVPEDGKYRLLTKEEHDLESEVRRNWPTLAEMTSDGTIKLLREMFGAFRYEHGNIHRPLKVAFTFDGQAAQEQGELQVEIFSPLSETDEPQVIGNSIAESQKIFLLAAESPELKSLLERTIAVQKTIDPKRMGARQLTPAQQEHRDRLEREASLAYQSRLPNLMRQALLRGKIYIGGNSITPTGTDIENIVRGQLRNLANTIFTEFTDARPSSDEECAAILTWNPGAVLPSIFNELQLVTSTNQILNDAHLLSVVRSELQVRQNLGTDRSGKGLGDRYGSQPYGWDPRLTRMLVATLFKAGKISVYYQNHECTDPTDAQVRTVFVDMRQFTRAEFTLLPDVDWRVVSERCSTLFGVQGGDTFEKTARIVQEQSNTWTQEAGQLAIRCQDNGLSQNFVQTCQQASQALKEIGQITDPNTRLRRLLEKADSLHEPMTFLRKLKAFDFELYRRVRDFHQNTGDWASALSGDAAKRCQRLRDDLSAADIIERIGSLGTNYTFLLNRYTQDYQGRHTEYQGEVQAAIKSLRKHPAFQSKTKQAEQALQPLSGLVCNSEVSQIKNNLRCPTCERAYGQLSSYGVLEARRLALLALDDLLPKSTTNKLEPLQLEATVHNDEDILIVSDELGRYLKKAGKPLKIQVTARPKTGKD